MAAAQCWVFDKAGSPLRETSVPLPDGLEEGECLVRLTSATICGSDVHTMDGRRVDPAAPLILGHEGVGEVVQCGAGVRVAPGTRVTWSVAAQCGACVACTDYRLPQKCASVLKYGHAPFEKCAPAYRCLSGTYASHIVLQRGSHIVPLTGPAAALTDAVVCPANCAYATVMACWRTARAHLAAAMEVSPEALPPLRVLVQGAGLLGTFACAVAARDALRPIHSSSSSSSDSSSSSSASKPARPPLVAVTDVSAARLEGAKAFGASVAVNTASVSAGAGGVGGDTAAVVAAVRAAAVAVAAPGAFDGFDVVLELCGVPGVVPAGLSLLRVGGVLVTAGMVHPASSLADTTGEAIIRKCAAVVGVHNYRPADLDAAVAFLADTAAVYPYDSLCSPAMRLGELPAAVEVAKSGQYARVRICP